MNWATAQLTAHIDKMILRAYGCDVEMVPRDTMPTFTSMVEKNRPDIAPEIWQNAYKEALDKAIAEDKLVRANDTSLKGAGNNWYLSEAFSKAHPEIKTLTDVIEHPELFPHPEFPGKGAFYGCPAGWACQHANKNFFNLLNMEEKGWVLVDPGSTSGLESAIAKAYARGENMFSYYWQPTAVVGRYNLQGVDWNFAFEGAENWSDCIANSEPTSSSCKMTAWPKSSVATITTKTFSDTNKSVMSYLAKRTVEPDVVNAMLIFMDDNQADGDTAAREFLAKYPSAWKQWVSEDIAKKVEASLNE